MVILLVLFILGLALGSFTNASVWRLHEQTKAKTSKRKKELSISTGRSMCPSCSHTLAWYDLIPLLSWVSLGGRCRYCRAKIPAQYPLVEISVGALLAVSWHFWPIAHADFAGYVLFALWAVILLLFTALFLYDLEWMELPTKLVYSLGVVVLVFRVFEIFSQHLPVVSSLLNAIFGAGLFGGFFWLIYQLSKGRWIGGGDVRLGFALGLQLSWQKTLLSLTAASYLATIVIVILMIVGKYHKKMKLPFGPFLIFATYLCMLWGQNLIDWYMRISGI
jgi:prepilin signal peptidase PulO-like enzyme (type II secretory pathway)